jgi:hypothetical protein
MAISADFEKQQQYFGKKYIFLFQYLFIVISFYRNIACENCPFDKSLKVTISEIIRVEIGILMRLG